PPVFSLFEQKCTTETGCSRMQILRCAISTMPRHHRCAEGEIALSDPLADRSKSRKDCQCKQKAANAHRIGRQESSGGRARRRDRAFSRANPGWPASASEILAVIWLCLNSPARPLLRSAAL